MLNEQKTEYTFSEHESAMLQEYNASIRELQQQQQGALRMIARQNNLDGNWDVSENKLVKRPAQQE